MNVVNSVSYSTQLSSVKKSFTFRRVCKKKRQKKDVKAVEDSKALEFDLIQVLASDMSSVNIHEAFFTSQFQKVPISEWKLRLNLSRRNYLLVEFNLLNSSKRLLSRLAFNRKIFAEANEIKSRIYHSRRSRKGKQNSPSKRSSRRVVGFHASDANKLA